MSIRTSYRHTLCASYLGYVTQAIVNNFVPLLLLTFHHSWGIGMPRLATLLSINFAIQLLVDLFGARFVDRIGYRPCIVAAHLFAGVGLVSLGILPHILPDPFTGLLISIFLYAIGGGLTEVLIGPIVEACPTQHKEASMSLLHSFYCWGHVFVILVSTAYFALFGTENWPYLAFFWSLIPFLNAAYFAFVPLRRLDEQEAVEQIPMSSLAKKTVFWLFMALMLCAGASEQAMSQWASAFAEAGLGVSKTLGDLAGPCMFAALMGLARLVSARLMRRFRLEHLMFVCCVTCVLSYLIASLSPQPLFSLVGCGLCGLSVGIMWPGTFSMASRALRGGGTALFAFLALAGDMGCTVAPWYVGLMTSLSPDGSLRSGLLPAILFPTLLFVGLAIYRHAVNRQSGKKKGRGHHT